MAQRHPLVHHGIPSLDVDTLRRYATEPLNAETARLLLLADFLRHEEYFVNGWRLEVEQWEHGVHRQLALGRGVFADLDLESGVTPQAELSELATYLDNARRAHRILHRRRSESTGLQSPAITSLSANFDARQEELLTKSRVDLREGYSLLASVAAGHQAEDSARVGRLVSIVTALLLVPSLIVSCVGIRPRRLRERRQSHDRRAPPRAVARGASPAPLFSWRSGSRSSRLSRRAGLP
jgi:hypothetical protein